MNELQQLVIARDEVEQRLGYLYESGEDPTYLEALLRSYNIDIARMEGE